MVVVNKFCCCCNLRTGTVTLACLGLIFGLLELTAPVAVYDNRLYIFPNFSPYYSGPNSSQYHPNGLAGLAIGLPFLITIIVLKLLCIISMGYGAIKGNHFFILPWLIMDMMILSSSTLLVLVGGITMMIAIGAIGILVWIIGFPILALQAYIWVCVLSCFQQIRDLGNREESGFLLEYPGPVQNFIGFRPDHTNPTTP